MDWRERAKEMAALEAVKHVKDGFVIGLGSGTTAAYAVREIGKRVQEGKLKVSGVPSSHQAYLLAVKYRIPVTTLDENPQLDLTIDGIDQIDNKFHMIKGLGGALTREKIIASVSRQNIRIADETKFTKIIGTKHAVPVEILPFAFTVVKTEVIKLGGKPVLREGNGKIGPAITDDGNFILDVDFGPIENPKNLDSQLKQIPGIIETGLFLRMVDIAYIGTPNGVRKLENK